MSLFWSKFFDVYAFLSILDHEPGNVSPHENFHSVELFDYLLPTPLTTPPQMSNNLTMILPVDSLDLTAYDEGELLFLKERISALLPDSLASVNLEEELLAQLRSSKALLADSIDAPANQRAQVGNSITTILKQLVDLQTSLTTTETIKRIERTLLETLKGFPELQENFLKKYEDALQNAGK